MRGPVSSSTWTISNNVATNTANWTIGTAAGTPANQLISGFTANSNVGPLVPAITAYKTPLSASVAFTNNAGNGTITMNCDSSSISFVNNLTAGSTTINNSYFPATINSNASVNLTNNTIFGNTIVNASGSDSTFTAVPPRNINSSIIGGYSTIGLVLNGNSSSLNSTAVIGGGLIVTGSNSKVAGATANNDFGSAFFGRWNAQDGNRAISGPTVFAVGTGTSTTRKTGFLIDSGSNTFVEGTLNVSGSSSFTGSITIQSGSGDLYVHGNKQFNVGAFQSNITQSGSANVSQSMAFETTDISQGVSIASNSRITLANAGIYNIQFSVQIDRVSGSGTDEVYFWLKKNGVNVTNTAGVETISGGALEAKTIAAWNYVVEAAANDYYELVWQSTDTNIHLTALTASGNIPAIPSVILTVTQVR
jgi:autotransporter-associated beta strand protein